MSQAADRRLKPGWNANSRASLYVLLLILLLLSVCAAADSVPLDPAGWPIERELLPHRWDTTKSVQLFWAKREGMARFRRSSSFMAIRIRRDPGPRSMRGRAGWDKWQSAAMSRLRCRSPATAIPADRPIFVGLLPSRQRLLRSISYAGKRSSGGKIALFGYSRGAIVAAMVAAQDPSLAGRRARRQRLRLLYLEPNNPRHRLEYCRGGGDFIRGLPGSVGDLSAEKIKATVLLLHGGSDERIPVHQAQAFAEKLREGWRSIPAQDLPGGSARYSHRRATARGRAVPRTIPSLSVGSVSRAFGNRHRLERLRGADVLS